MKSTLDRGPTPAECWIRSGVIVVGLGLWLLTQAMLGAREFPVDSATEAKAAEALTEGDRVLGLTAAWNEHLRDNRSRADQLLIVSSALIDLVACWMFAVSIFGRTIRPFLGLLILFSLRQLCQWISPLPAPVGMLWESPGFPSLLVTYEVANDFFFSGHTALAVYGGIELARRYGRVGLVAGVGLAVFETLAVLVLRAHYTMDVFTGVVVAMLAAFAAAQLADRLDRVIARWARVGSQDAASSGK